jgi:hypothetical protein
MTQLSDCLMCLPKNEDNKRDFKVSVLTQSSTDWKSQGHVSSRRHKNSPKVSERRKKSEMNACSLERKRHDCVSLVSAFFLPKWVINVCQGRGRNNYTAQKQYNMNSRFLVFWVTHKVFDTTRDAQEEVKVIYLHKFRRHSLDWGYESQQLLRNNQRMKFSLL